MLPKANFISKKGCNHCLLIWCYCNFLNPCKTIKLKSMLDKSMRCIENCNIFSRYWSAENDQLFTITSDQTDQCFKNQTNCASKICPYFNELFLPIGYYFSIIWLLSTMKTLPLVESRSIDFCATRVNKFISCWQHLITIIWNLRPETTITFAWIYWMKRNISEYSVVDGCYQIKEAKWNIFKLSPYNFYFDPLEDI